MNTAASELRNILLDSFDSDHAVITDFNNIFNGVRVDVVYVDSNNQVSLYAGNPELDKYCEELLPDRSELDRILEEIMDYI